MLGEGQLELELSSSGEQVSVPAMLAKQAGDWMVMSQFHSRAKGALDLFSGENSGCTWGAFAKAAVAAALVAALHAALSFVGWVASLAALCIPWKLMVLGSQAPPAPMLAPGRPCEAQLG